MKDAICLLMDTLANAQKLFLKNLSCSQTLIPSKKKPASVCINAGNKWF